VHPLPRATEAFLFAAVATFVLTDLLRRLLVHFGWVDEPTADRWHRRAVARPGGPAMAVAMLLGTSVFLPFPWSHHLWGWAAGASFIFLVGLADDIFELSNPLKLMLLVIGAAIPLFFGASFAMVPALLGTPLALLWILGVTNAVNWLDNMDGLAAGVSAVAALALVALAATFADPIVGKLAALVAGACVGFLPFNVTPARIFMGDSGSGLLGFTLATLTLAGAAQHVRSLLLALLVPVMVLSVPIFDTAIVTMARLFSGRHVFQGGVDHPSHRLVVLGLSERDAVRYLWGLSALSAAAALVTSRLGQWTGLALAGILGCAFTAVGMVIMQVRVYQLPRTANTNGRVVLWQLLHKRRLLEIVLDLVLLNVAYIGAYLLRFEGTIPPALVQRLTYSLPIVITIKMVLLYAFGMYRSDWRHTGLLDLLLLVRTSVLGSFGWVAVVFVLTGLGGYSRSVFILDWLLTVSLLAWMRVSVRLLREYFASRSVKGRSVLIFGAGQGGVVLLQELRNNPALRYYPVGFVDDDPVKQGGIIRGLRVLGSRRDIPALVVRYRVQEVLVAAPSIDSSELERLELICREAGAVCRAIRPLLDPSTS
jgi:UDP-GlcNAc:undecaprenyl-phosphate GlcNAc-1-phosphate transferase